MPLNVLNLSSPLETIPGNSPSELDAATEITIKGFASVSRIDRDREVVVDPNVFDIATFMQSPTLLMNHKFIMDNVGTQHTAGLVTKAIPAYVADIVGDSIKVHSIASGEFVDELSVKIAPRLQVNDRGLFIHAKVTHPAAKEKVRSGELGGLSWRGFARKSVSTCDGEPCKLITKVDLIEISLVHHQNQPQSTFMIAKSIDGKMEMANLNQYPIYGLRFQKFDFPSAAVIRECMKSYDLDVVQIDEDDLSYVAYVAEPSGFEVEKSVVIPMGGVEAISAPARKQDELIGVHVGKLDTVPVKEETPMADKTADTAKRLRLYLLNEQGLLDRFPGLLTQSMKNVITTDGEEIEILTLELPEVSAEPAAEKVDTPADEKVAPKADHELKSELAELKSQIASLGELVKVRAEVPKEEPAKQVNELDQIRAELEAATAKYANTEKENENLRDTLKQLVERFNSQVPGQRPARDERIEETRKSAEDINPFAVVGNAVSRTFSSLR